MESTAKKWLKGCGCGCGIVALAFVLVAIGGSYLMVGPFRSAIEIREALDERHGEQSEFSPAIDGAIPSQRLEAFMAVREALMEACSDFGRLDRETTQMDSLDEDASGKEIATSLFGAAGAIFNMVPQIGKFFDARNRALRDADMGLGEYTYIYTLAYMQRLRPDSSGDGTTRDSNHPNARVRAALTQMLRNQLAGLDDGAAAGENAAELIRESLIAEIDSLERDSRRLPWQDGLPPPIAASLEPHRATLDRLYCDSTVQFEFTRNRQNALGIQGN